MIYCENVVDVAPLKKKKEKKKMAVVYPRVWEYLLVDRVKKRKNNKKKKKKVKIQAIDDQ